MKTVIHLPKNIELEKYKGNLYGYFFEDTNHYNIIKTKEHKDLKYLGYIVDNKEDIKLPMKDILYGYYENEKLFFMQNSKLCEIKYYELILNVFSRNTGILESPIMLQKRAIICGCGSVGSLVALELARSGVGNFMLIDHDILEYHNICRHQCGIKDVGKYKTNALKERILDINSNANIMIQNHPIEQTNKESFDEFCNENSIIIACADNRRGDLYANTISYYYNIPFVSIGFWQRAFAGEIFYSIPHITPCYSCQFKDINLDEDVRVNANHRFYIDQKELEEVSFEPGISVHINFVTIIAIKLILDLLNKDNKNYIPTLIKHLSQYTFVCNTNDIRMGNEMAEIFSYPLQVTTSIKVNKNANCKICAKHK